MKEQSTPPSCHCAEPMNLVRTIPHVEGVPEIFVFYCARCKRTETRTPEHTAPASAGKGLI